MSRQCGNVDMNAMPSWRTCLRASAIVFSIGRTIGRFWLPKWQRVHDLIAPISIGEDCSILMRSIVADDRSTCGVGTLGFEPVVLLRHDGLAEPHMTKFR